MAGRDISVTHEALGPVRVMRTCGMMGEIVGMAASLCKQYGASPREVYTKHLDALELLMQHGVGKTNGAVRLSVVMNKPCVVIALAWLRDSRSF